MTTEATVDNVVLVSLSIQIKEIKVKQHFEPLRISLQTNSLDYFFIKNSFNFGSSLINTISCTYHPVWVYV